MTCAERGVARLNVLPSPSFLERMQAICAGVHFGRGMLASRPFASLAAMLAAADTVWASAPTGDRLVAFAAHPPIGRRTREQLPRDARFAEWSAGEQSGVAGTADEVLDALEAQNAAYADKFGFVFLVCATGRSAGEMLALLAERLGHGREEEVAIAGEEQRKITALRLGKLAAAEGEGGADTRGRL